MDLSSIFNQRDSVNFLVEQTLALEGRPRDVLIERKDMLGKRKSVLSDLDAKLSALQNRAKRLNDAFFDYFGQKKAVTSNAEVLTASAGTSAATGTHAITVERLASTDTRVSQQYSDIGTDFTAYVTDQTFSIEVASPTDDDPNNRVSIDVTVGASVFALTNDEVLQGIADAINDAMTAGVTDETISNDERVQASVVTEENGVSRLVLRSGKSGYTNRLDFGVSGLLDDLQVNAASQSSGTAGGYITEVGSSASTSMLNAKFQLDGLTFYRDSNNVTGAIEGVTLQLLDDSNTAEDITVNADVAAVKEEVKGFLEAYNEALKFLRDNTRTNTANGNRATLVDDYAYKDMINTMRGYVSDVVGGTLTDRYDQLFDLGIEADSLGFLSIKDAEKFAEALETNSQYVADVFTKETGFASRIETYIDNFVKAGGTISNSKQNLDNEMIALEDRISFQNELLSRRETQLREEMSQLQGLMISFANQQSYFASLNGAFR